MNLIEESFKNREEKKKKRTTRIILGAIILVVIIIIAIVAYLMYLQNSQLRLTLDGVSNERLKNILIFEDNGTIYVPIKEVASYFGYESYNGEYSNRSEDQNKCYIINENEVVNFELGEEKIYRLDLTENNADYVYSYMKQPVRGIGGVLCISTQGMEEAFNVSFQYNQEKNRIAIWTLPYLYKSYATQILDYQYTELSNKFVNQRAILDSELIVKGKNQYGVIGLDGTTILEAKYDNITYLPNTGDFLVENNKQMGILSKKGETKVQIMYDSIELMDSDAGLYAVKKDNKFGVVDVKGNIVIYIENDEIGIDISKFSQNNIKNRYILADSLIPVKKDDYWGLYDKNGNQIVDYKYDSLGYVASNNRNALNLLVIPNYNVLVACKDDKYTLVNSSGRELFAIVADDIYMTISGGENHYYIVANDQRIDAEDWLDENGTTANGNNAGSSNQTEDVETNSTDDDTEE